MAQNGLAYWSRKIVPLQKKPGAPTDKKSCIWLRAGLKYFKAMFCFDWRRFFSPETKKWLQITKLLKIERLLINNQTTKRGKVLSVSFETSDTAWIFLDRSRGGTSPNFLSPSWARAFKVKPGRASSFSTFNRLGNLSLKIHSVEFDIYVLIGEMIRQNLMLKI